MVGIAASAGGLEAVSELVKYLPQGANAVYVVAQHMSPTHKSVLSSLISRETEFPVFELEQETTPEPNTIYVTPPNSDVVYERGKLRLRNPAGHPASPKPLADRLFKSLAENCGEHCVGIVLSGTGSDGSYGVQSIREEGGITIAQDPSTAKYDGMPSSAIETGCVDLILSPDAVGQHLEKILASPRDFAALRPLEEEPSRLSELLGILMARTQVNFADYKEATLNRRIARRMTALGIDDYADYVDYCRVDSGEVDALHRDLLISVTRFFRDPEQFDSLRKELEKTVAEQKDKGIRIWVVGCATGEEAYSIAILVAELLGGIHALHAHKVQIFATDIDNAAIETARRGVYPITAAQDIPAHYLSNYFTLGENEITVRPELRAITLFSRHNVFQDPPFINVSLVSIRNVLIYFNQALQERVVSRLHYALASNGLLFLGTSETVGEMRVYFEARRHADKVFAKRRGITGELSLHPMQRTFKTTGQTVRTPSINEVPAQVANLNTSIARAVAPNGFMCTKDGTIIEILGDISQFLEIRSGTATTLSIKMLLPSLRTEAVSLIAAACRAQERKTGRWHRIDLRDGNAVQIEAIPFTNSTDSEVHCLVGLTTRFEERVELSLDDISDEDQRAYVERMEQEIRATQEALQQTIEELQTANEELQSANEELQSTNEEFQATNEELETSNEELQSTNEELLTVNEELQISATERMALASELEATMAAAPYVLALVDQALMVRRVSNVGLDFVGLDEIPPLGIHVGQLQMPQGFPSLAVAANNVLRLQESRRVPVLSEGKYFDLALTPVHDVHGKLLGVSITISQLDSGPVSQIVRMMSDISHIAHWSLSIDTNELVWSPEAFRIFERDPSGAIPTWEEFLSLTHPDDRERQRKEIDRLLNQGGEADIELRVFRAGGHVITVQMRMIAIQDTNGTPYQLLGLVRDIAPLLRRDVLIDHLEDVQNDLEIGFYSLDVENNATTWNDALYKLFGHERGQFTPTIESLTVHLDSAGREEIERSFIETITSGEPFNKTVRLENPSGYMDALTWRGAARKRSDGRTTHVYGSIRRTRTSGA